jgi:hypothetical protein
MDELDETEISDEVIDPEDSDVPPASAADAHAGHVLTRLH